MTKFNAKQFAKFGFTHVNEEDFTDDGTRFQIWLHEETGVKVSFARYNYKNEFGEIVNTEYFISPRLRYYSFGLMYEDVCNEPEYSEAEKFNGCYEVDLAELVAAIKALKAMFMRKEEAANKEEIDFTPVAKRAKFELDELEQLMNMIDNGAIKFWNLEEYALKNAVSNVKSIERHVKELRRILFGEVERKRQRELVAMVERRGYVVDELSSGSKYSSYNELVELVLS